MRSHLFTTSVAATSVAATSVAATLFSTTLWTAVALATTLLSVSATFGQTNAALARELDSLYTLDQRYRAFLATVGNDIRQRDSLARVLNVTPELVSAKLWETQSAIDRSNLARVEQILAQHGYPGKTLVGTPANEAAWHVMQHSDKIGQFLPVIGRAAEAGELPFRLYAMMLDRDRMQKRQPQRYGTQAGCYPLRANPTQMQCFIWPIEDYDRVNALRKQAGFDSTVEENARRLNNAIYERLTVEAARQKYVISN